MKRLAMFVGVWLFGVAGIVAAQSPAEFGSPPAAGTPLMMTTVPATVKASAEVLPLPPPPPMPAPPAPVATSPMTSPARATTAASPGEGPLSPDAQAYLRSVARDRDQAESVRLAAIARAEQRTHRLESQRWFGISNSRPMVGCDPYNSDYAPTWVSNNLFYPCRWVGGQTWAPVEGP